MSVNILKIEGKEKTIRFIKSQWKFYEGDKNWVPPIVAERMQLLDVHKNPFFEHSEIQMFLAYRNRQIAGRIAAITNANHNEIHKDKVGFFGFFECENNQETADTLFYEAEKWLKEKGMDTIRGPENPSQNDEVGLLVDGYDKPPVILMPYNPPYYQQLIENYGFEKAKDLYAYHVPMDYATDKMKRLNNLIRERYNLTIRQMDFKNKQNFKKDVDAIKKIYNSAWEPNWGFVKMTDKELDHLAVSLKQVADPNLVYFALMGDNPVGFAIALPDINQCLIYNKKGNMLGAIWHILTKRKKINYVRILVLGVMPEYQKKGIDSVMYQEMGDRALGTGYLGGEASWILEDNEAMNRGLTSTMNAHIYKTYRLYEKKID